MHKLTITLVLMAVHLVAVACDSAEQQRSERRAEAGARVVGVITHPVSYEREVARIEAVGTARARTSAMLYAETGGAVTDVLFTAGAFVDTGTVLLQLEADDERLSVQLAEVAVREAEQLLARYRRIEDTGAVSDSQIDEAQTALDAARINLERARLALAKRSVSAPFAGFISISDVDVGVRITPSTPIAQLDDRRVLFVDFQAPEQVFQNLTVGETVRADPFAEAGQTYQAEVISIDSRVDPDRRTFTVRAAIDNDEDALRPGMSFKIAANFPGAAYPVVPEAAILWGADGSYLWLVRDGVAERVPVTIITRQDGRVLVRGDIPKGVRVIAEGVQKVRDGTRVRDFEGGRQRPSEGRP